MARYSETFIVSKPVGRTANACRMVMMSGGWKLLDDQGWAFLAKERFDLVTYMFTYPSRFAILLREEEDDRTLVELHGSMFGFGPLPQHRMRKVAGRLRESILLALGQT